MSGAGPVGAVSIVGAPGAGDGGAGGGAAGVSWVQVGAVGGVVLLVCAAVLAAVLIARRRDARLDPAELALRRLARRMRLGRREVEAVRSLGAACGAAPVALLLSEHAFETASAARNAVNFRRQSPA